MDVAGPTRRRLTLTFALVAGLLLLGLSAQCAYAGEWMQVTCLNPDQSVAPFEGWWSFADGASASGGAGCGGFGLLSATQAAPVGTEALLYYQPPSGSTLAGGTVDVTMSAYGSGVNATGTAIAASPTEDDSDIILECALGRGGCGNGAYAYSGTLSLPANRGGEFYLWAGCDGVSGYSCDTGAGPVGAWSEVQLWWADMLLSNDSLPSASGFGGGLLSGQKITGTASLTFTASDPAGPGVYTVSVLIDGTAVYSATPNANGGECVPVGNSAGALMFDYQQPCLASEPVDLPISTAALPDGQHDVKVIVTDAAQNSATVLDQTITTANRTTISSNGSQLRHPPAPQPTTPPPPPPPPCNAVCDSHPQLQSTGPAATALDGPRSVSRSAVTLTGRLLTHTGAPIAGAQLQLIEQPAALGLSGRAIASTTTTPTGTWTFKAPTGPSRTLTVVYLEHLSDSTPQATLAYHETVKAPVKLHGARHARIGQRITFTGSLPGGYIPAGGQLVAMQILYGGQWRTIDLLRTNNTGAFAYAYQFSGVPPGAYRFRALVPASPGYPYAQASSPAVTVTVH